MSRQVAHGDESFMSALREMARYNPATIMAESRPKQKVAEIAETLILDLK